MTCFDFRLPPLVARYMEQRGLAGRYDHVALAGASLGLAHSDLAGWGATIVAQIQAALELHGITRVLLLDHRDCGAYRVYLGLDSAVNPVDELAAHSTQLRAARDALTTRWPRVDVELLLMDLDGTTSMVA